MIEKNFEQCTAIRFCCKAEFTAAKKWEMFVEAFGDSSVLRATVLQWHGLFVVGEESIEEAEQNGKPGWEQRK